MLRAWRGGDEGIGSELMPLVYDDLHLRAQRFLARERRDHTLQPTALVNEAYLRLIDQRGVNWQDRAHFFAIAAKMMRRVLLDHARKHNSAKRGSGQAPISIEVAGELALPGNGDVAALDDALNALAEFDAAGAAVIEMRFFAGLSIEETAEVLKTSPSTVVRQWRAARAWLYNELSRTEAPPSASLSEPVE